MSFSLVTTILTLLITLAVSSIVRFYATVRKYPRGLFPLPLLGNILEFKDKSLLPHQVFDEISRKCGKGIFTFWMSSSPFVVVTSYEECRELYHEKKNSLAARPPFDGMQDLMVNGELDMALRTSDATWSMHRKIASKSVRQLARSPYRARVVESLVDQFIGNLKRRNSPVNPTQQIKHLIICSLTEVTFGGKYSLDDATVIELAKMVDLQAANSDFFILVNILPAVKYLMRDTWKQFESAARFVECTLHPYTEEKRKEIAQSDGEFECRDFLDAFLLAAQENETNEEKMTTLTQGKIVTSVWSLFLGGVHTTKDTLRWAVLILAMYPDTVQNTIRREVKSLSADEYFEFTVDYLKDKSPLLNAFIAEVLRFRPVGPTGIPRCAVEDIHVNGVIIPKGSTVLLNIMNALHSESSWQSPETFNMYRFIDEDGHFNTRNASYIPFSVGRRSCVGENFAKANLFLILFKLIDGTERIKLVNQHSVDLLPDPKGNPFQIAKPYEILIE